MPLSLAIGYTSPGRDAEPVLLYLGNDASAAQQAAKDGKPGIVRADYIKAPIVTKRVFHETASPAPAEAPAPAEEPPAEEPAPAPRAKSKSPSAD